MVGRAIAYAVALTSVAACGRLGFDPLGVGGGGGSDAGGDGVHSDVLADACSFGPFGNATQVANVNGNGEDFSPHVSPDGLSLYFGKQAPNYEVYRSVRGDTTSAFPAPAPVTELNTAGVEGGPSLAADQLDVVFFSNRIAPQDIWLGTRATTTQPFGGLVTAFTTTAPVVRDGPELSPDGLTLYYTYGAQGSNRELHRGRRADRASRFTDLGAIAELSSPADDALPSISDDHLELYFRSNRGGSYRLWLARRATTADLWGTPVPLPDLDSFAPNVSDPELAEGGTAMYFTHDAGDGTSWNIYVARRACTGS